MISYTGYSYSRCIKITFRQHQLYTVNPFVMFKCESTVSLPTQSRDFPPLSNLCSPLRLMMQSVKALIRTTPSYKN